MHPMERSRSGQLTAELRLSIPIFPSSIASLIPYESSMQKHSSDYITHAKHPRRLSELATFITSLGSQISYPQLHFTSKYSVQTSSLGLRSATEELAPSILLFLSTLRIIFPVLDLHDTIISSMISVPPTLCPNSLD